MNDDHIDAQLHELTQGRATATHHIEVGADIARRFSAFVRREHPNHSDLFVCDRNTYTAMGEQLLAAQRATGRNAEARIMEPARDHDSELVCDDDAIASLVSDLEHRPEVNPIAVGAGTINDIVKMACHRIQRPYQCVPTAASMNGYTSGIAAVLSGGVKRTLPARPPQAIFADLDILCRAPAHLAAAGFGDLLSKPFSHADWLLSHRVRSVAYDPAPARLLDEAYDLLLSRATAVGNSDSVGIGTLMRTLLLSGFSMALAGTSAPASGGEHLISHYWDMEQHCARQPLRALHGTQVGIATRISAMLFERLVALDAEQIDVDAAVARRRDPGWLDTLAASHPQLTPQVVDEVREQIASKQKHGEELRAELLHVKSIWSQLRRELRENLLPADMMTRALGAARAATKPSDIGVEDAHAVRTLKVCRHIRSRYVGLDLMSDLGFLDGWAPELVRSL